jgi:rfaE bifunctional protein nucleotidyltransferase chain/domain/rfaE bifunctional protein kinase chain/domain
VSRPRIVVVGDTLLDRDLVGAVERLAPDAPVPVVSEPEERVRPGGAGLAAWLAASDADVALLTALGDGQADATARRLLHVRGVDVRAVARTPGVPQKIRVRADGQTLLRMERSTAPASFGDVGAAGWASLLDAADVVLVSDYGGGLTARQDVRELLARAVADGAVVWDPHPRGGVPVEGCAVLTPNVREACWFAGIDVGDMPATAIDAGRAVRERFRAAAACVTLGAAGAVVVDGRVEIAEAPPTVVARDVCGAGDRFAVALAHALATGRRLHEAAGHAVRAASAYVADPDPWLTMHAGGGGSPDVGGRRAETQITVATSGCFDLLHAGHVRMLAAARSLGDRLVVLLNDDPSVRRLKGGGRPIVTAAERAELLRALHTVDEVRIFSEDTPERALADLRPDIYVKGGDYAGATLPEREVVERSGGRVVIVPYEDGRSTTALIDRAVLRTA